MENYRNVPRYAFVHCQSIIIWVSVLFALKASHATYALPDIIDVQPSVELSQAFNSMNPTTFFLTGIVFCVARCAFLKSSLSFKINYSKGLNIIVAMGICI